MTPRPNQRRIRDLLDDLEAVEADLEQSRSIEQAAYLRADRDAIQHSLWLAGHPVEELV